MIALNHALSNELTRHLTILVKGIIVKRHPVMSRVHDIVAPPDKLLGV